jgi:hypothetical protein
MLSGSGELAAAWSTGADDNRRTATAAATVFTVFTPIAELPAVLTAEEAGVLPEEEEEEVTLLFGTAAFGVAESGAVVALDDAGNATAFFVTLDFVLVLVF